MLLTTDYVVSHNKTDFESSPSRVTLSRSEGSVALESRCFAAAQHDKFDPFGSPE